jgi:nucleoside-diphosphate-sugar epimerase
MGSKPLIAVVGADGFVGSGLAAGLGAERVVYGPCRGDGDVHISQAEPLLRRADVIVNASGFRVRRGLTLDDYRRCHQGSTSVFVPWVRKDALFLHMSSAHVLGKSREVSLGNDAVPHPESYPSAIYSIAKYECDQYLRREADARGFKVIYLRPTILWARLGDTSLIDNLCKVARRGRMLRLYPRNARHHFCYLNILMEVAAQVVQRNAEVPHGTALVVADPFTITSEELEAMMCRYLREKPLMIPIPAPLCSALVRCLPHSSIPALDFKTWGDIFGVLHLDTVYDPWETFRMLKIDPSRYAMDKTLEPFVRRALQGEAAEAEEFDAVGAQDSAR